MSDKIQLALYYATETHYGQFRKDEINGIRIPYIIHPIEVMKRLFTWRIVDEEMAIAALLHDLIEDTETTYTDIEDNFGQSVADIVLELSQSKGKETKRQFYESFALKSNKALLIKVADLFQNSFDFKLTRPDYAPRYFDKAKIVFEEFHRRYDDGELDEFGRDNIKQISLILKGVAWNFSGPKK